MDDRERGREAKESHIDADSIMRRIREDIRKARARAEIRTTGSEIAADQLRASERRDRFDDRLYQDLDRLHTLYDKIGVGLLLDASPLPLIAPLVQRVRSMLHRLVIYYVNRLAETQIDFNEHVTRILTAVVGELDIDRSSERIETLEQEITQLRARIDRLQTKGERNST